MPAEKHATGCGCGIPGCQPTPAICPGCFRRLDGSVNASGPPRPPKPGDLSVCAHCGTALVYAEGGEMRFLTEAERARLPVELQRVLADAIRTFSPQLTTTRRAST